MTTPMIRALLPTLALSLAFSLGAGVALADDEVERVPPVTHAATLKECGACHMAYQPAFLSAGSWNAVMDGLATHFGENAGLSADAAADIRRYLTDHAGRGGGRKDGGGGAPVLRISDLGWWQKEHRRIAPAEWRKAGSKANCQSCHRQADQGMFEDD